MSTPNGESGQDRRSVFRTAAAWLFTTVAFLLVWFSLVAPNDIVDLTPGAFLRIPVEALIVVALAVILPTRARVCWRSWSGWCSAC